MTDPLLITNGTVVTWVPSQELLTSGAVYVENGLVAEIGTAHDLEARVRGRIAHARAPAGASHAGLGR